MIKVTPTLPNYPIQERWDIGRYTIVVADNRAWHCGIICRDISSEPVDYLQIVPVTKNKIISDMPSASDIWEMEDHVIYYYIAYIGYGFLFDDLTDALNFIGISLRLKEIGLVDDLDM